MSVFVLGLGFSMSYHCGLESHVCRHLGRLGLCDRNDVVGILFVWEEKPAE